MIVSRSNYRISILGGGTDFPEFYSKYGSYIIGFGLNHHVYVMASFSPPLSDVKYQAYYSHPEKVNKIEEFENPAIRGSLLFLQEKLGDLSDISLHINNTLPSRTGIGSSSSLIVSILHAIYKLFGITPTRRQLANETNYIERDLLKEPGGYQDPFWASYGGIGSLDISHNGFVKYKSFNLSAEFIQEFSESSIIFYYSQRQSFDVAKTYKNNDSNQEKYKFRILDIAKQGKSEFENENIAGVGKLLEESWKEKKQISSLISTSEIDDIHDTLISNGAYGVKVTGSGGGGMLYCLCPRYLKDKLISLIKLPTIDVDFDYDGSKIICFA